MTDTPTTNAKVSTATTRPTRRQFRPRPPPRRPCRRRRPRRARAEPIPFWQRPYVERFLVPLVLPIAVIVGLVVYILNISRSFLSGHGHIPIFVGSVITVMILVGRDAVVGRLADGCASRRSPW